MKLNVWALALTGGILWGGTLFVITWWIILFDGPTGDPTCLSLIYRGYNVSPLGSLIGLAWGIIDGLIGGALFAWVYNWFAGKSKIP